MLTETATYLAYATGWRAVRLMPEAAAYRMFDALADQQWRSRGRGVQRLEANLARVLGEVPEEQLREVSRAGMRSYMRYWCDAFRMPGWDAARINSFVLHDVERIDALLHSGRGVVLALPHMGNWDHAGAYVSLNHSPVHSVAERLKPDRLFEAFLDYRASLGMRILGLGDPGVFPTLAGVCRDAGLVALLADRDLSSRGVPVTFLGEATRFAAGPAALAVDTGAALLPITLSWAGDHNSGVVHEEIVIGSDGTRDEQIGAATQELADVLAGGIRAHPEDWHMLQRLWLADLDPDRLAARDSEDARSPGGD